MKPRASVLQWQLLSFGFVGGVQLLVDWLVFVALSALGVPVLAANLGGRVSGASLGFWLNGTVTFRHAAGPVRDGLTLLRFLAMWLLLTAVSSVTLWGIDAHGSLKLAWLAKPLVEAVLAMASFVLSRHWVYRRRGVEQRHRP